MIPTKIKITANHCDDTAKLKYIPQYEENDYFKLFSSIKPIIHDHQYYGNSIKFAFRTMETIDCGIYIDVPKSFKLSIILNDNLSKKGMFILNVDYTSSLKVIVSNFSHEIITISDGDYFAKGWLEPVFKADWIIEGV